jgi:hypothetical protein
MATQIQFRRGTKAQHNAFTGATGEVTVDTTNLSLHVHDGITAGGFESAKVDLSNHSGVGVLTATTFSGNVTGNVTGNINSSGISTLNNVVVGGATTALIVNGDARVTGILTVGTSSLTLDGVNDRITVGTGLTITSTEITIGSITIGSGSLTGTATSTTNIPNLTGAITSVNTTTSLGSFTSAQLAGALTDETGSGAAVFATSPTLITPVLGAASASSINVSGIVTATQFVTGAAGNAIGINTNTISGPATITIDPAGVGDNTGLVVIKGDLQIDGTTTTINSTTLTIDDKNIVLGSGAVNDAAADGSGITIESGNGNKTFQFEDTGDNLGSSENLNVASGKVYKVNNTSVLSATTLGSGVINSSLTSVGTLTNLNVGNVNSSGIITATTFVGALTGTATSTTNIPNLTGDITSVDKATTLATVNSNIGTFGSGSAIPTITVNAKGLITGVTTTAVTSGTTITDDTSTDASRFLTFTSATSGSISAANVSSTKLTFNPSTGTLTATDINSTSDINLKENIRPIENPLNKVLQLNGVEFDWKDNQQSSIGVIAQELEKVFPSLVKTAENKSVNYNGLIGVLVEAVKEQQKQIEELKKLIQDR